MKSVIPFILIIFLLCLNSCSLFEKSTERRKSAGISKQSLYVKDSIIQTTLFWAHYDATQRGGLYMVTNSGKVVVISEPPPDAGVNSMLDIIAKANVKEVEAGAKVSAVKSIAELGKRNAANYVVRDIAFRIETLLNNNHGALTPEVVDIYKTLLTTSKEISIAESKSDISKAKADLFKELNSLIEKTKDAAYKNLNLDSTFFKKIQLQLDN